MSLGSTFDRYSFSSHASFAGPFVSAKLSLFAELSQDSGVCPSGKLQFYPKFVCSFCLGIFVVFPKKLK